MIIIDVELLLKNQLLMILKYMIIKLCLIEKNILNKI
jgi:hypothetical protein